MKQYFSESTVLPMHSQQAKQPKKSNPNTTKSMLHRKIAKKMLINLTQTTKSSAKYHRAE
jgi:hypothetical protein